MLQMGREEYGSTSNSTAYKLCDLGQLLNPSEPDFLICENVSNIHLLRISEKME